MQGAVPVVFGLMRIDDGGVHDTASLVHHRYFDAGAYAGIQAHRGAGPCGRCQQQIFQVAREHVDGVRLGFCA